MFDTYYSRMPDFAQSDMSNNIDDNDGGYVIEISDTVLYLGAAIISLLLIMNIICLSYYNCCASKRTKTKRKYRRVSQIPSSEDDMQNLKEYAI